MAAPKGSLGDWLRIASSVEPELAAAPRALRREVLERAAERYGRQPSTIHRMVRAYRYVVTRAKAVGVELNQIAAPVVCIEILERMERRSEPVSLDFRRRVLSGELSFQQLRVEERALKTTAVKQVRNSVVDWRAFCIELSYDLFEGKMLSAAFGADRKIYSHVARNLSVDWEVELELEKVAVFLSPQCVFSEFRGGTVLEQLPRVIMAALFYDRWVYLPWDVSEVGLACSYLPPRNQYSPLLSGRLEILPLMSMPHCYSSGEFYRA